MKQSYKDLKVWQKATDLASDVYRLTQDFPAREQYGLSSQIRKSAVSIASNIAEGSARHSNREFTQFLIIARGSAAELHTQLIIAMRAGYLDENEYMLICRQLNETGKMINGLITSLTHTNDQRLRTNN